MPITVRLDEADSCIVRFDFTDTWTWDKYYEGTNVAAQLLDADCESGDIIFVNISHYMPSGVMRQSMKLNEALPSQVQTVAIVSANSLYQAFGRVLGRLFPTVAGMYVYCDTTEEARQQIRQRREARQSG